MAETLRGSIIIPSIPTPIDMSILDDTQRNLYKNVLSDYRSGLLQELLNKGYRIRTQEALISDLPPIKHALDNLHELNMMAGVEGPGAQAAKWADAALLIRALDIASGALESGEILYGFEDILTHLSGMGRWPDSDGYTRYRDIHPVLDRVRMADLTLSETAMTELGAPWRNRALRYIGPRRGVSIQGYLTDGKLACDYADLDDWA